MSEKIFVIAEAGLNFCGSLDKALLMVDAAKAAGADAVKFQTFLPSFDPKLSKYTLTDLEWNRLFGHTIEKEILFMSTPFDRWAVDLLKNLGVMHWKVPSGELTNDEYLRSIPDQAQTIYLSTGMANMDEINHALDVLPNPVDREIYLMYCVSGYPTQAKQSNLLTIQRWRDAFPQYEMGFSDHSTPMDFENSHLAVALGATAIERHFQLNELEECPDTDVSVISGEELKEYVRGIREVEARLGDGFKTLMPCEKATLKVRNRFK